MQHTTTGSAVILPSSMRHGFVRERFTVMVVVFSYFWYFPFQNIPNKNAVQWNEATFFNSRNSKEILRKSWKQYQEMSGNFNLCTRKFLFSLWKRWSIAYFQEAGEAFCEPKRCCRCLCYKIGWRFDHKVSCTLVINWHKP